MDKQLEKVVTRIEQLPTLPIVSQKIMELMANDDTSFKDIVNVIEKNNFLEIERQGFLESLKRTNLFTEDTFNAIQLIVDENKLVLSSQNMDYGNAKDEMEINYKHQGHQDLSAIPAPDQST